MKIEVEIRPTRAANSQQAATCRHLIPKLGFCIPWSFSQTNEGKSMSQVCFHLCWRLRTSNHYTTSKIENGSTSTIEDSRLRLRRKPTATTIPNKREMKLPLNAWKNIGIVPDLSTFIDIRNLDLLHRQ
jgi:hypothetical protein